MIENPSPLHPDNPFQQRLQGKFSGILRWEQLDTLWEQVLDRHEGWYVYEIGRTLPEYTAESQELPHIIEGIDQVLRHEHKHDYCGIVYADNPAQPTMIKVYDPGNLGVVCGPGGAPVLPRWIITRIKPQVLGEKKKETGQAWWKHVLHLAHT